MVDKWFSFLARQSGDCWLLLCCIFCIQFQMDGTSECCGLGIQSRHGHSSSLLPVFKMCIVAIQKLKNEKIVFYAYLRQEQTIFSKGSFTNTLTNKPVSRNHQSHTGILHDLTTGWSKYSPVPGQAAGACYSPFYPVSPRDPDLTRLSCTAESRHRPLTRNIPTPRVRRPISTLYLCWSFLYYTYIQFCRFVFQLQFIRRKMRKRQFFGP